MNQSNFQVNLSGVLKILSDSLYSSKDVFIRELIQNSIDAITARRLIDRKIDGSILVEYYHHEEGIGLVISDNGIGLTRDEIEEFLSKIGASSKSVKNITEQRNDFIGQFGIGLLSCFMVCDEIVLYTKSVKSNEVLKWTGLIGGSYSTEIADLNQNMDFGTKVILKFRSDIDLSPEHFISLIVKYGRYVTTKINLEINSENIDIKQQTFPWIENDREKILQIGYDLFDIQFNHFLPIKTLDGLNNGIAFIYPSRLNHSHKPQNAVFVKNMFITDKSQNVLPEWAFFVKCIINSDNLSPTASREEIYQNKAAEKLSLELGSIIKNYFQELSISSPQVLEQIMSIHQVGIKSIALEDENFLKFIFKSIKVETNLGSKTIGEIRNENKTILYISDEDQFRQLLPIATANGNLIVNACYIYERELFESISEIDSKHSYLHITSEYFGNNLEELTIDENDFIEYRLDELKIFLDEYDCDLEVKKFEPNTIPAICYVSNKTMQDDDIEEIRESADDTWSSILSNVYQVDKDRNIKLFLNYKNNVVQNMLQNESENMQLIIETLYFNSKMMGHYPMSGQEMIAFNQNLLKILNKL